MARPIAFAVSFFWMSAFAFLAVGAAGLVPAGPGGLDVPVLSGSVAPLLAIGFSLVATVFLWAFVAVVFDRGGIPGDIDWIARIAFASAILMTSVVLLVFAHLQPLEILASTVLMVTALAASLGAVDVEGRAARRSARTDNVGKVAGLMAAGAAHNTMLSAISRRALSDRSDG